MGRDTITLEQAVSTISQEYLQLFCSDYFIPESLHPELPGPEDAIVNFPEGKIGVYCKFFEFANYRIPITQFLFDLLGYYQIHLSQLSVIGAAKSGWMSFAKRPRKDTPTMLRKSLGILEELEQPVLLGEYPLRMLSLCSAIDRGTPVMSDGCRPW
ncbi:hypothetical protein Tco_1246806 [Tanacetum coccineum]